MPNPYLLDLRWRIIWAYLAHRQSSTEIGKQFNVSECTVRRYITRFHITGDIEPSKRRHGPVLLLGEFEQMLLLRMILEKPGVYPCEIQEELLCIFGAYVCMSTICRMLKMMGCTRQAMRRIAIQRSDEKWAEFMADISLYDVSMLVWLDESGCDDRNYRRKYGYCMRGIPPCDHRLLIRGTRYTAILILSVEGVHDVYIAEGNMNGDRFTKTYSSQSSCLSMVSILVLLW